MKSEPDVYSYEDLERDGRTYWEGVRNYQARNLMREMSEGDHVLYYHSNAKPPGVVGVATVVREAYPDFTAEDPDSHYYDPKSSAENPRWSMVDITPVRALEAMVTLTDLKENSNLEGMAVVRKGQRLSVQPVLEREFDEVLRMATELAHQDSE